MFNLHLANEEDFLHISWSIHWFVKNLKKQFWNFMNKQFQIKSA